MKDIAIFAEESSLFASPFLADALDCPLYVKLPQYNNLMGGGRKGIHYDGGKAIKEKNLIIVGVSALLSIADMIGRFKSVSVIFSDSLCASEYLTWNKIVDKYKIPVYIMPGLIPYCNGDYIPVYQTIKTIFPVGTKPSDRIVIAHSPRDSVKRQVKGTPYIIKVIDDLKNKYPIELLLITNKTIKECIQLKSKAHIFIDQIVYGNKEIPQGRFGGKIRYEGDLSKSGQEAMILGCCTITGAVKPDTSRYFPCPPVIWTSYNDFPNDLEKTIQDTAYRNKKAEEQMMWAREYLSSEFVAKHITQHIK